MKIQELAIIFIIIILPISILLSEYTQFQIQTLKIQTAYDTKLTAATYDAIKAFQLNTKNETYSDIHNSKVNDIENSVNAFRNSIMSSFKLNGYTEEELNNYIPALVYTLYDGFYIYSPYTNINYRYKDSKTGENITNIEALNSDVKVDRNGEMLYGLKPYINYSCRYVRGNIDVVITYALDNYVTVQGKIGDEYVNRSGYLIDNITIVGNTVKYNGITIEKEQLKENIGGITCNYAKIDGTKYYLLYDYIEEDGEKKDCIIYIANGTVHIPYKEGDEEFIARKNMILYNDSARQYYIEANKFTEWFKSKGLKDLTYGDARDEVINDDGTTEIANVWEGNNTKIFDFNSGENSIDNIENESSNFNQHRLAVIRHKIEMNLAIAISNYNEYSNIHNVFQMPQLEIDEWEHITHNISLISFLQGLPIGGKVYNGYSLVTNSESEEVVLEENIYILGNDKNYHKIGDKGLENGGGLSTDAGSYVGDADKNGNVYNERVISSGRLNLDFERQSLVKNDSTYYYYPLREYNASYDSVVMKNNVTTYDDIYTYVNSQGNDELKTAFYTALGRERASKFNNNITIDADAFEGDIYEIIYYANTDDEVKNVPLLHYKIEGIPEKISEELPTRKGYTFLGWSTLQDGDIKYAKGNSHIYFEDANLYLYAVWNKEDYTVKCNANGGEFEGDADGIASRNYKFEDIVNINDIVDNPVRTGYQFLGWSTNLLATIATYVPGERFTCTGNITLYAVWNKEDYTVKCNSNGGEFEGDTDGIASRNYKFEDIVNINDIVDNPICIGYQFLGWSTNSIATIPIYAPGETFICTGDITLYAVWKSKIKDANVGEYVKYTARGYSSWRIMYNNDGQLDLVSEGSVGNYTLAGNAGYLNAVIYLNEHAKKYVTGLANNARSIGCTLSSTLSLTSGSSSMSGNPYQDTYYIGDVNQLINYGLIQNDVEVWLASRKVENMFLIGKKGQVRTIQINGKLDYWTLQEYTWFGQQNRREITKGFRPVVSFPTGLKIVGGDGTKANPYKLSE